MVRKETRHILRDWQTLLIILVMPVAMMFLYGYALTLDVTDARVVVEQPSPSSEGRRLTRTLDANSLFRVVAVVPTAQEPALTMEHFDAKAIVKLPPNLPSDLRDGGTPATVQVLIDGSDQNVGTILMNAVRPVLRNAALELIHLTPPEPISVQPRVLYNPEQETALFFVPGLMAIILILTSALLTSLTITREKETGTMEQLLVSPVRPWEVVLGKIAPYIVIAATDGVLVVVVGRLFFGVEIAGSAWFLAGAGIVYIVTAQCRGRHCLYRYSTFARLDIQHVRQQPATGHDDGAACDHDADRGAFGVHFPSGELPAMAACNRARHPRHLFPAGDPRDHTQRSRPGGAVATLGHARRTRPSVSCHIDP